jgi:hypothetical protein
MATYSVTVTKNSIYEFTVEASSSEEAASLAATHDVSSLTPITTTSVNAYQQ